MEDVSDHPDGPGAEAFYCVAGSPGFRAGLVDRVREWWPSDLVVDGEAKSFCPRDDIDAEFAQFNSCASIRAVDHVLSGVVPGHLVRNEELRRSVALFRGRSSVAKRPASALKRPACESTSCSSAAASGKRSRSDLVS